MLVNINLKCSPRMGALLAKSCLKSIREGGHYLMGAIPKGFISLDQRELQKNWNIR
jgi:hypothetical protein